MNGLMSFISRGDAVAKGGARTEGTGPGAHRSASEAGAAPGYPRRWRRPASAVATPSLNSKRQRRTRLPTCWHPQWPRPCSQASRPWWSSASWVGSAAPRENYGRCNSRRATSGSAALALAGNELTAAARAGTRPILERDKAAAVEGDDVETMILGGLLERAAQGDALAVADGSGGADPAVS